MPPSEESTVDISNVDETRFSIGYFFGEEPHDILIRLSVGDAQVHIRPDQALGLANLMMQAVHRADAIAYAVHTHMTLTHNDSKKRKSEFLDAVNSLIAREEAGARATVSPNGDNGVGQS